MTVFFLILEERLRGLFLPKDPFSFCKKSSYWKCCRKMEIVEYFAKKTTMVLKKRHSLSTRSQGKSSKIPPYTTSKKNVSFKCCRKICVVVPSPAVNPVTVSSFSFTSNSQTPEGEAAHRPWAGSFHIWYLSAAPSRVQLK